MRAEEYSERMKENGRPSGRTWDYRWWDRCDASRARKMALVACEELGLSLESMAGKVGVSETTLWRVLGGIAGVRKRPDLEGMTTTEYVLDRLEKITGGLE